VTAEVSRVRPDALTTVSDRLVTRLADHLCR
jgi:hypothetical protein